jgi:hypothetical protein
MENPDSGCGREAHCRSLGQLGMTKFKWLANLRLSYSDGKV